jgi:predicted Zn-ribbon and HTH transcriptional regulator
MPKVNSHDIRKIIFDNFNDTDTRFSNDEMLSYLNQMNQYKELDDVLDFEDTLLDMEKSGLLRPIAQNFNTRYYRLWNALEPAACKACGFSTYFAPSEEGKTCPKCNAPI